MPSVTGYLQGDGVFAQGLVVTNPDDQDVLVDTLALEAGNYLFSVVGSCSADAVYDFEIRNADNDATTYYIRRRPSAGNEDLFLGFKLALASNQRARCISVGGLVGNIQLNIVYGQVG